MPGQARAVDLYQISRADIDGALESLSRGESPPRFIDSTRFDLIHAGRRYPPKAVIALAARRALGGMLTPSDFSGGESSTAFRVILDRGFEIVTKLSSVSTLDATFSVGRSTDDTFLIVESKGPNRNTDYLQGLEVLLSGLADLDISISDVLVEPPWVWWRLQPLRRWSHEQVKEVFT